MQKPERSHDTDTNSSSGSSTFFTNPDDCTKTILFSSNNTKTKRKYQKKTTKLNQDKVKPKLKKLF